MHWNREAIRLNEYQSDFLSAIRNNKKNIYHPKSKKKYRMYFENLKGEERKIYMEETNLKDFNINEMTAVQFRELSKDTQFKIISELVEKYRTDAEISRHIKIGRCTIGKFRRELGIASNKHRGNYRHIKKQNTSPKKAPTFEKPQ